MKLAIIGHGTMGRLVHRLAEEAGHNVGVVPSLREDQRSVETLASFLIGHNAAIDFSVASSVVMNVTACVMAKVPLVEGTTGWTTDEEQVREIVTTGNGSVVYGANFSIGMNVFYRITSIAGEMFGSVNDYDAYIEEAHHKRKLDAPSGTALVLRGLVGAGYDRDIPITSTRAGYIPGTHRVAFDSPADQIALTHTARSRDGFANGAIFAAGWIMKNPGFHGFSETIDDLLYRKAERS